MSADFFSSLDDFPDADPPATEAARRVAARIAEHRRFARAKIAIAGRYMLADRREFPCRTLDISAGGMALEASTPGAPGERIVVYLDELGRFEGEVARLFPGGFALSCALPATRREKLVNRLTWLLNHEALGLHEDRRHRRITPRVTQTQLRLPSGDAEPAKIIDLSVSGAAIQCARLPPLGATVDIGRRRARVVRLTDHGAALEFVLPLDFDRFDENIVL